MEKGRGVLRDFLTTEKGKKKDLAFYRGKGGRTTPTSGIIIIHHWRGARRERGWEVS